MSIHEFMKDKIDVPSTLLKDVTNKLLADQEKQVWREVEKELKELGHVFENQAMLRMFAKERLTLLCYGEHWKEIRIDHSDEKRGILLCKYSTEIKSTEENGKFIITIG